MDGSTRIDELEQKFIENPRRYFAPLANEYRKAGNPHQAIAICRAHLGQLPGHMSGQIVYGQALFEGGEYDEARTVFENALAMDRENLVALRHLGDLALRNGETAAARQWYEKVLDLDPRDATVIALVNEIDASADAQSPAGAAEESAQQPGQPETPEAEVPTEPARATRDSHDSHDEDRLISEELGVPVPPPQAFVTETMAELYLAQGFRDRALGVYRQLAALRPDDERLKARLAELEAPAPTTAAEPVVAPAETAAELSSVTTEEPPAVPLVEMVISDEPEAERILEMPVEARREEAPSEESPEPAEHERAPSIESPLQSSPEVQPPSEESASKGDSSIDASPMEAPAEEGSIEAPEETSERAEPEGIAARISVRDFFAGLGRRRPHSNGSQPHADSYAAEGSGSLEADRSGGADARAAAQLAGAFGDSGSGYSGSAGAPAATAVPGKESEEDVARFRAWLDGLTGK